jgi:hypothetical protein
MPVGGLRFIRERSYAPRAALGLILGGIPAVLVAAFVVKELPLGALRWSSSPWCSPPASCSCGGGCAPGRIEKWKPNLHKAALGAPGEPAQEGPAGGSGFYPHGS